MPRTITLGSPLGAQTAREWRRFEQVGLEPDFSLDDLILNWVDKGAADLEAKGALTALSIERTIEGGSTVTMSLRDRDLRVFSERAKRVQSRESLTRSLARTAARRNPVEVDEGWEPILAPDVIGRAMEVELDGVVFRLVKVRYSSASGQLDLTFEDRIVYWLRRKRGERRASRATCTRAEFVLSLLREVRAASSYRFVCPELHVRQPIDKGKTRTQVTTDASRKARQTKDVPRELDRVYPRHRVGMAGAARLSERQVRAVAELAGLSPTDALHAAQIAHGESDFYPGVVQDDPGNGMVGHGLWQVTPNAWGTSSAAYKHMQSLGGLEAMRNPIQCARQMKWLHDQAKGWSPWYGTRYLKLSSKASGSVLAEGIGTDSTDTAEGGAAGGGEYIKSYQFTRNADEDSWTAIKRLADEVGWRFFVVGNSVYYMSEEDLYGRRPRYEVKPDDPAILDLSYDIDWGKPVSELTLTVVLDRWGAPPGAVVLVDGYGPPDGRWLIVSVSRDYFQPTATVTCRQPSKESLEPASERVTRGSNAADAGGTTDSGSSGSGADAVFAKAKEIDARNYPYVWGGGHGTRGEPSRGTGRDPGIGYDCSGYVGACLLAGGYGGPDPAVHSSQFGSLPGAKPGRGTHFTVHYNGGHVYIVWEAAMNTRYKRADTSRQNETGNAPRGPHLRMGDAYGSFSLCHFE